MKLPGAIGTTFGDLVGKLTVLRVECSKCGRFGRYRLYRLIEQRGRDVRILDWLDALTATVRANVPRASATNATRAARTCRRWCDHQIEQASALSGGRRRDGGPRQVVNHENRRPCCGGIAMGTARRLAPVSRVHAQGCLGALPERPAESE